MRTRTHSMQEKKVDNRYLQLVYKLSSSIMYYSNNMLNINKKKKKKKKGMIEYSISFCIAVATKCTKFYISFLLAIGPVSCGCP
jgi:hypothetical protein